MKYLLSTLLLISFVAQGQDTTVIITPYPCDSVVTTTLPQRVFIVGYDTTVIPGTNYKAYYQTQVYTNVIGDVTVITPIYDTIPAHDTTFTCSLCGTCYDTSYVINKPIITVRPANQSKTYGQLYNFANNGSSVLISAGGLIAGDVITGDNSTSAGAATSAVAGSYTIPLSSITIMRGATDVTSQYNITFQSGTLTVTQLSITITANNQGKTAGQIFTFTQNGTQVSGTIASGDNIAFDNCASTGAGAAAAAGTYPISLSAVTILKGATNVTSSYSITYVGGTLTVAAAPLFITVQPKPQSKVYGSTFVFTGNGTQVNIVSGGLVGGDVITTDNSTSSGAAVSANAGSYSISLSAITIMRGATNVTSLYTITYQSGTMAVTTRPISVRANNQTKTEGAAFTFLGNGTQVSVVSGALLSGHAITADNAASTGSGPGAADGTYNITLSSVTIMNGATNVTANYAITYQTGTLTVLPVTPPQAAINGMLPNYSPTATVPQKIAYTLSYSCNGMRNSYDPERPGGWPTEQIKAAGLFNLLTYNTAPVGQPVNAFPTAAEIPRHVELLDSILTVHEDDPPDIICFQNEEANDNYWSGPVTDYVRWLNAAAVVAHAHGLKCANGGLLQNVIYYIRWVYQQEGKTDSVLMINQMANIGPNTGTAAQYMIDWYKVEIPAIAASDLDYVDFHFYEPMINNPPNKTTPSGLVEIIVNFLRSRTGKVVITSEFGTDNASQDLFNATADMLDGAGVKIRFYYAGDGNVAENHAQYWEDWINQNSP